LPLGNYRVAAGAGRNLQLVLFHGPVEHLAQDLEVGGAAVSRLEDKRILEKEVFPTWGHQKAQDIY